MSSSPFESTTFIETEPLPALDAVPVTSPVDVLRDKPAGNAPVTIENVSGLVAPVTTALNEVGEVVVIDVQA